ncbi:MAG: hypothetical protein ACPG20_04515, partial [Pontimonas sp.]
PGTAGIMRKEIPHNRGEDCLKVDALSRLARITIWELSRKLSPAPAIVAGRCNDAATWAATKLAPSLTSSPRRSSHSLCFISCPFTW